MFVCLNLLEPAWTCLNLLWLANITNSISIHKDYKYNYLVHLPFAVFVDLQAACASCYVPVPSILLSRVLLSLCTTVFVHYCLVHYCRVYSFLSRCATECCTRHSLRRTRYVTTLDCCSCKRAAHGFDSCGCLGTKHDKTRQNTTKIKPK